jgi:hypothetical protein
MRVPAIASALVLAMLAGCSDDGGSPSESGRWTLTGRAEDADAAEYCVRYSGVTEAGSTMRGDKVTVVVVGDRQAADAFAACAERRGANLALDAP